MPTVMKPVNTGVQLSAAGQQGVSAGLSAFVEDLAQDRRIRMMESVQALRDEVQDLKRLRALNQRPGLEQGATPTATRLMVGLSFNGKRLAKILSRISINAFTTARALPGQISA